MGGWRTSWVGIAPPLTATPMMTRMHGSLLTSACGSFPQHTLWGMPGNPTQHTHTHTHTHTRMSHSMQYSRRTPWHGPYNKKTTNIHSKAHGNKNVFIMLLFIFISLFTARHCLLPPLQGLWPLCIEKLGFSGVQGWSELVHSLHPHRWWQPQRTRVLTFSLNLMIPL